MNDIEQQLWLLQDLEYQKLQTRILPNLSSDQIIGVRTPALRTMARQITAKDAFISGLPHRYFEENQLHAFIISEIKDFDQAIVQIERFLPYINNWATCDQLSPKVFRTHHADLLPYIQKWITMEEEYAVRFAIKMLMDHFLGQDFDPQYLEIVASVRRGEYYIKMMVAWFFATALAKQYDSTYPYISGYKLEKWEHNKTIQKAVESFRISPEQKNHLRLYKIK